MRLFIVFLLFPSLAFATGLYDAVPLAAIISAAIIGIAYMISQSSQNPQLETWVRSELKEIIFAIITIGVIHSLVSASTLSVNDTLKALTGYADMTALTSAAETQFRSFSNALSADYIDIIKTGNRINMLSSYSYTASTWMYFISSGKTQAPYLGASGLMQPISNVAASASTGIMIYETMIIFLKFFFQASYDILLPVAFIFRLLPFTRKMGGTLLGLALAGIFIYPFSMVIAAEIHKGAGLDQSDFHSSMNSHWDRITLKLPDGLTFICTNRFIRWFTALNEYGWWVIICPIFCSLSCIAATVGWAACFWPCVQPGLLGTGGTCWTSISYPFYTWTQRAFLLASSIMVWVGEKNLLNVLGSDDSGIIFDIVMGNLVNPVSIASTVPIMEAVLVAGLTIVGARGLSAALSGELAITGLERLI